MSRPNLVTAARALCAAEETLQGYRNLYNVVDLLTAAKHGAIRDGVIARERDRLASIVEEFEADVEECRDAFIALGGTPDQYDAWLEANPEARS